MPQAIYQESLDQHTGTMCGWGFVAQLAGSALRQPAAIFVSSSSVRFSNRACIACSFSRRSRLRQRLIRFALAVPAAVKRSQKHALMLAMIPQVFFRKNRFRADLFQSLGKLG